MKIYSKTRTVVELTCKEAAAVKLVLIAHLDTHTSDGWSEIIYKLLAKLQEVS